MQAAEATIETDFYELAKREIARWYDVFYAWSRGLTPATEPIPRQIWDALTPDFRVVLTDGRMLDKREYGFRLADLHGARAGSPKSQIVNVNLQRISHAHLLATFDLIKPGAAAKKFDTAILRRVPDQPYAVMWAYVHESAHEF